MSRDPERLSSLLDQPELSEPLRNARARLPDADALERLRARVTAAVAAPPPTTPPPAPAASWPVAAKLAAAAVVVGGAFLGVRALTAPPPALAPGPASAVVATAPPPAVPTPSAAPPITAPPEPVPSPRVVSNVARPSASPPVAAPEPAISELSLISQARRALASDPAQAFALTRQHQALYPSGVLSEEREVIAIESLARLGNLPLARARAERFSVSFPRSAHLHRVQQAARLDLENNDAGPQKNLE